MIVTSPEIFEGTRTTAIYSPSSSTTFLYRISSLTKRLLFLSDSVTFSRAGNGFP